MFWFFLQKMHFKFSAFFQNFLLSATITISSLFFFTSRCCCCCGCFLEHFRWFWWTDGRTFIIIMLMIVHIMIKICADVIITIRWWDHSSLGQFRSPSLPPSKAPSVHSGHSYHSGQSGQSGGPKEQNGRRTIRHDPPLTRRIWSTNHLHQAPPPTLPDAGGGEGGADLSVMGCCDFMWDWSMMIEGWALGGHH